MRWDHVPEVVVRCPIAARQFQPIAVVILWPTWGSIQRYKLCNRVRTWVDHAANVGSLQTFSGRVELDARSIARRRGL